MEALPASMDPHRPPAGADISLALGSGQIMCSLQSNSPTIDWSRPPAYRAPVEPTYSALVTDLEHFAAGHRAHGDLFADAGAAGPKGYRRRVTPQDAGVELVLLARWN